MKTKTKLLIAIGIFAALCIGFLLGIIVDYPKVDNSDVSGTIGKADKYRKTQMTEKDIQLRSELLEDTAQLKNMIQGLVYFSLFTEELCADIDLSVIAFKQQGMGTKAGESDKITALKDYSDFIRNNNEALKTTIDMLSGFYLNDTADISLDVEKNLKDFETYVNSLNEKNEVFNQALLSMDNFMLENKTLQSNKEAIEQLKSVRDQLLIKGIQTGGLLNNKKQTDSLIVYAFTSQEKLNVVILGQEKLASFAASEKLQYGGGLGVIKSSLGASNTVSAIFSTPELGVGLRMVYDKPSLQFIFSKEQLNIFAVNLQSSNGIAFFGAEKLNIVMANYSAQEIVGAQILNSVRSQNTLQIFSMDNLQAVFASEGYNMRAMVSALL